MPDINSVDPDPLAIPSAPPVPPQVDLGAKKAIVVLVLDETASMTSIKSETIDGVNAFFSTLKTETNPDDVFIGAWTFSDIYKEPVMRAMFTSRLLSSWQPLLPEQYRPRGFTPLYDAIGIGITQAEYMQKNLVKADGAERRMVIVIQTDGDENRSREISLAQLRGMIDDCTKRGWEFIFLGADLSQTEKIGASIGTQSGNTMDYDSRKSAQLYAATAFNAADFVKGKRVDTSYTVGQRDAFDRKKNL